MMPMGYNLNIGLAATTYCIITIPASVTLPSQKLKAIREAGISDSRAYLCVFFSSNAHAVEGVVANGN